MEENKHNGHVEPASESDQSTNGIMMDRRKLLKAIGATSVAVVAGGLINGNIASAFNEKAGEKGKKDKGGKGQGADCCDELSELIGDPQLFRPEDADLIAKMLNESTERAVNLGWFSPAGNGTTDDSEAWNAAIAAVPPGGSLFVPPGTYFSADGFVCERGDITIFGAGPSSHLTTNSQRNALRVGTSSRMTRIANVNVHSLKFSQQAGPSGSGEANNYSGLKSWFVDRIVIFNNDFEYCDVAVSLAGGGHELGFPARVSGRNIVAMNRMLNTRKMGVEVFFQDNTMVYANKMINENGVNPAESHGIRLIGSHHTMCIANEVQRFRTGISNQGGSSNGYRESNHFINAHNKIRQCLKGIQGFEGAYNGQILSNSIEMIRELGIEFRLESKGGWDNLTVTGNLITADPDSGASRGATFTAGERLIFRNNQSIGFGNGMSSGSAYHVYVSGIGKLAVVEGNYFEDNYYISGSGRNRGVRVDNNAKTVISRNNVFLSPSPNASQQNSQDASNSTGALIKGYAGVEDMNDYLHL
ncbi:hypothetical protein M6D81_10590 [Paenibacillus sp. J5C_2022]|uniref:hypothetical protein n=1 Tax=Paenibacillus sp. J5C2022 TaxID=2977129 RepID=UPI0021D1CDD5|nr:hypothetical protein [Paenibacillus sp. J5C2022]MCU6709159.1 hypothetical protein [Paenibacillus sp. J5C2022]